MVGWSLNAPKTPVTESQTNGVMPPMKLCHLMFSIWRQTQPRGRQPSGIHNRTMQVQIFSLPQVFPCGLELELNKQQATDHYAAQLHVEECRLKINQPRTRWCYNREEVSLLICNNQFWLHNEVKYTKDGRNTVSAIIISSSEYMIVTTVKRLKLLGWVR
jgi:hypothetical protein